MGAVSENTPLTGGVPTEIGPVKATPQIQSITQSGKPTVPEFLVVLLLLISERDGVNSALTADDIVLHRVTLSGVPLVVIESTHNLAVYNISDYALAYRFGLTRRRSQDVS
jgi:hypothetical protein